MPVGIGHFRVHIGECGGERGDILACRLVSRDARLDLGAKRCHEAANRRHAIRRGKYPALRNDERIDAEGAEDSRRISSRGRCIRISIDLCLERGESGNVGLDLEAMLACSVADSFFMPATRVLSALRALMRAAMSESAFVMILESFVEALTDALAVVGDAVTDADALNVCADAGTTLKASIAAAANPVVIEETLMVFVISYVIAE